MTSTALEFGPAGQHNPLRGVAAAVVKNMTASLEVPTATSVRAVPAKLMADNRIVINNFLQRNRGGKVSFTHLIGFAIVRAMADFPTMNRSFAVVDGRPSVLTPTHINLGLAIDLPGRADARNLVGVPTRAAEAMSFTQFWSGYEQVVRKSRAGSLTAEGYAGTTGRYRDQPLGAPADARAERDHRRRGARLSGGIPGHERPDARRTGHLQDHHADLDLRSSGHPGRRVGRVPAEGLAQTELYEPIQQVHDAMWRPGYPRIELEGR